MSRPNQPTPRGRVADAVQAWWVSHTGPSGKGVLRRGDRPAPVPEDDEVLVRVTACGVCRTDLHLVDGDLPPRRDGTVPGHQVVGTVMRCGTAATRFEVGDRVGIAWLRRTCGACRWCRVGAENLCPDSSYTGWDADGGFAQLATVPEAFAYRLPAALSDLQVAPLLCAGIIGYRALTRADLPPGGRLGIYGFGSSAHITAQIALASGAEVYVITRGETGRALARRLGAAWVGGVGDQPSVPLDSAIIFAPAGELVPSALESLDRGGTLTLAGIYMSAIPPLDYGRHLFQERAVRSVTANTRADGEALLRIAGRLRLDVHTTEYGFSEVDHALADLAADRVSGSVVITGYPTD